MWEGINGHLSRGGDFQKRKAFVETYNLEGLSTFGLQTIGTDVWVFGSGASPGGLPAGVNYQRLQHSTNDMTAILWSTLFDGKIYAIAEFDNGDIRHFYDGSDVADWHTTNSGDPGNDGTPALFALTFNTKVYAGGSNSLLYFSKINDPADWNSASTGAGSINMSNQDEGSADLTGLATYIGQLAIFSRNAIQIWSMDADPANNAKQQVLRYTGTRSPGSVQSFGDLDVFYLHSSGIRSLRARDSSNAASVSDVGTLIDPLIQDWIDDLTGDEIASIPSIIEPSENRYWLGIGNRIVVFSHFPGSKISGWSWYEPGITPEDFADSGDNTGPYVRAADKIYKYGGSDDDTYGDDYEVVCALPFMDAQKPGHWKDWMGFDLLATGDWEVRLRNDPNDLNRAINFGSLSEYSVNEPNAPAIGRSPSVAPYLTHQGAGYAAVSGMLLHYATGPSESQ